MAEFHMPFVCFSYRLADHPQLSAEFTKHLKRLPQSLNTSRDRALYRRLIDTYGTHYIHQVRLIQCTFPAFHTVALVLQSIFLVVRVREDNDVMTYDDPSWLIFQPSFHYLFMSFRSSLVGR